MTEERTAADPKMPAGGLRLLTGFRGEEKDLLALFTVLGAHRKIEELLSKALAAYNEVNWVAASPDGLVGGQGYMMPVRELREKLITMLQMIGECKHPLIDECFHNPVWKPVKTQYIRRNHPSNSVSEPEIPAEDGTDDPGPGVENLEEPEPDSFEREIPFEFVSSKRLSADEDSAYLALSSVQAEGIEGVTSGELLTIANQMGGDFRDEEHVLTSLSSLIKSGIVGDDHGLFRVL